MTLKTLTTALLLAISLLLFTACDSNTDTTDAQNPVLQADTLTGNDTEDNATEGDDNTTVDGTDDNTTNGGNDDNTSTTPTVTLSSLKLTVDKTSLNKDENTTVKVMATYSNNSTKEVTDKVEWVVTPGDAVKVTETTLTARQDKATTIQAKIATVTSDAVKLNITWTVNGHTLPPEPDKVLNDSTLLGIDSNDNGVRDDVERWIYEEYKDKHPIHIDIAMQAGRAWQKVLEDPNKAKEIYPMVDAPAYCEGYFRVCVDEATKKKYNLERISTSDMFVKIVFNTTSRWNAYLLYDKLLSGDTYSIPWCSESKQLCDFNTTKYEE